MLVNKLYRVKGFLEAVRAPVDMLLDIDAVIAQLQPDYLQTDKGVVNYPMHPPLHHFFGNNAPGGAPALPTDGATVTPLPKGVVIIKEAVVDAEMIDKNTIFNKPVDAAIAKKEEESMPAPVEQKTEKTPDGFRISKDEKSISKTVVTPEGIKVIHGTRPKNSDEIIVKPSAAPEVPKKRMTVDQIEPVEKRLIAGESLKQIGEAFGGDYHSVYQFCVRHGIDATPAGRAELKQKYEEREKGTEISPTKKAVAPMPTFEDVKFKSPKPIVTNPKLKVADLTEIEDQVASVGLDEAAARRGVSSSDLQRYLNGYSDKTFGKVDFIQR